MVRASLVILLGGSVLSQPAASGAATGPCSEDLAGLCDASAPRFAADDRGEPGLGAAFNEDEALAAAAEVRLLQRGLALLGRASGSSASTAAAAAPAPAIQAAASDSAAEVAAGAAGAASAGELSLAAAAAVESGSEFRGAVGAGARRQSCPTDALVGNWTSPDALGSGRTAWISTKPPNDDCIRGIVANFDIVGVSGVYSISAIDKFVCESELGKRAGVVKLKFENAQKGYFHEGIYDVATDTLIEDVSCENGKYVGGSALEFHRTA